MEDLEAEVARSWWKNLFTQKKTTTVVESEAQEGSETGPSPAAPPGSGAPAVGVFSFMPGASGGAAAEAPAANGPATPLSDTVPNPTLTTGRLRGLGLAPVLVPSLREQLLLHRLVAQEHAETHPGEACLRWQAVLALAPDDLDARRGLAEAFERLHRLGEAAAAYQYALELAPDDATLLSAHARVMALISAEGGRPQE